MDNDVFDNIDNNDNKLDGNNIDAGSGMNAQEQLRAILGETGQTAQNSSENIAPAAEKSAGNAAENVSENVAENAAGNAVSPDMSSPDPSVINWARSLWRYPGSTYGTAQRPSVSATSDAASRKGGAGKVVRTILLTLLCLILGVVAALQFKAIAARNKTEPESEQRINQLYSTIINLNSELDSLEAERNELKNRLDMLEQSSQEEQIAAIRSELNSVRTFAGLTGVKGKGIHIQLDFTERTNVNSMQNMLLLLINELRASGAQAISINGVRILAMTEIRVVSDQYISVNARQLIAPYDIYAIGNALDLYSGITMGGNGIVYQLKNLAGTTCSWDIQENIVIGPATDEDIKTDLLTPNP